MSAEDAVAVAIDTGPLYGPRSGVATAVDHLVRALREPPPPGSSVAAVEVVPFAVSFRARLDDGTRRLPLPAAVAHRLWARANRPRADRWLRPAEVVHGANYVVPPTRLPRVVSVYDCWFLRHADAVHPDVRRAAQVLRRAVRSGAVVHASSHATAAGVRELLGAQRVRVVHLGAPPPLPAAVDAAPPLPGIDGAPYVLALGTLERRKNLPRLVRAFDAVAATVPGVRLVLAGGGDDDRPAIDDAIAALAPQHTRRVVLTGRVDDSAKAWLLRHAAALAYPSLDEGFGFPLLEAMAAGAPIVASNAGSIPEVAGDGALLVDPLDVDALAEGLVAVLDDSTLRARLAAAAPARLATFTWQRTADEMRRLYCELAHEGSDS